MKAIKETRDIFEQAILKWQKDYGIELSTSQKHALLYGVVPEVLDALSQQHEREIAQTQRTGVAWAIKEIDDMHMNSPAGYDKLFKGIKNSLRDRCMLQAGYDPAPSYPVMAELQQQSISDKDSDQQELDNALQRAFEAIDKKWKEKASE